MDIIVYKGKKWLVKIKDATMVPRIGESMYVDDHTYKVKDVIWNVSEVHTWIEIQVD